MTNSHDDTIASRISRVLAERIISGALPPGARLRQDHLAEEFGASHVPVREAFRRLEAQGLAVSEPRRGVRVAAFDLAEVREVAEMRAALEVLALRHAMPNLTPAVLERAAAATTAADAATDVRAWETANRAFHRLILEPCAMPRLLAAIDDLHAASARFLFPPGNRVGSRGPITIIARSLRRSGAAMARRRSPSSVATSSGLAARRCETPPARPARFSPSSGDAGRRCAMLL